MGLRAKLVVAGAMAFGLAACAGARHRKVAGPPPEYEKPDDFAAYDPKDGGPADGAGEGGTEFMLVSPDGRP